MNKINKNVPWHILAPSAVACDKLHHRASAHRWQVMPFCVLGSSNGIFLVHKKRLYPFGTEPLFTNLVF